MALMLLIDEVIINGEEITRDLLLETKILDIVGRHEINDLVLLDGTCHQQQSGFD
jgi:hypothetical protein